MTYAQLTLPGWEELTTPPQPLLISSARSALGRRGSVPLDNSALSRSEPTATALQVRDGVGSPG